MNLIYLDISQKAINQIVIKTASLFSGIHVQILSKPFVHGRIGAQSLLIFNLVRAFRAYIIRLARTNVHENQETGE